jgi:Zn-dependent protease
MGWQDRPYYRDQGNSSRNPLSWILYGSLPLFTVFNIRVRMSAALLVVIVWALLESEFPGGMGAGNAMTFGVVLFGIVLLHEFGHCFAARRVGGEASDVTLGPLGGLAFVDAPNRPWPQLVTAVGGPAVNVIICAVTYGAMRLIAVAVHKQVVFNPLIVGGVYGYLAWIFAISLGLLIFNLLPIYPLDGGRILQCLLWFKLRFYRATLITCVVGLIGSALMVMYGITAWNSWYGLVLIFIGASCFWTCFQTRAQLKAAGPWEFEDEGIDYSASLWHPDDHPKKHKKLSRRAVRRLRKQAQREEEEQAQIDAILSKVSAHGMHSLTWLERRALRKATERQRRREIEVSDRG